MIGLPRSRNAENSRNGGGPSPARPAPPAPSPPPARPPPPPAPRRPPPAPTTPPAAPQRTAGRSASAMAGRARSGDAFDDGGVGLAAALAHGLEPVPAAGALELVHQLGHQDRPGGAEWMAERDRTAVGVRLGQRSTGVGRPRDEHGGERLVDLEDVDVRDVEVRGAEGPFRPRDRPGQR